MTTGKRVVDWDLVEVEYRAGVKSLRQLGDEHGVSHVAINKRAKAKGWTRDLSAKIKAKADAKVTAAAVTKEVTAERVATEQQVVEANSDAQAAIRLSHRKDIGRTRALFGRLLAEVELFTEWPAAQELLREMTEIVHGGEDKDGNPKKPPRSINEMLDRVLTGPGRIESAKKLTEILEKLVKLERQAFGIDDEDKGGSDLDRLLLKIERERNGS